MPWNESKVVEERRRLVALVLESQVPVAEAARLLGVSRKTAFKWLALFRVGGLAMLVDRSRAPESNPRAYPTPVRQLLVEGRLAHPHWGPRKLIAFLQRRRQNLILPAPSTVGLWLHACSLVRPRKRGQRGEPLGVGPFPPVLAPNDVWCTDYMGEFHVGNGEPCYPFTLSDAHTRFLIRCTAMRRISTAGARAEMESAFREDGLPVAMRSDNGSPFASHGLGGLTRLAVWLLKLGVQLQRIEPGRPQQNGIHERMHRTLQQETALEPKSSLGRQQRAFDAFRQEFNYERPHEALGNATPASLFKPSPRPMPRTLPDADYPTSYTVRSVDNKGFLRWRGQDIYLCQALSGERLGLIESEHAGWWRLYFLHHELGLLHANGKFVERIHRSLPWPESPMSSV